MQGEVFVEFTLIKECKKATFIHLSSTVKSITSS